MTTRVVRSIGLLAAGVVLFVASSAAQRYEERQIGGVGITVFRDENFRGENATFRQDVPDLHRYGFNDRITSLRVAPGEYWEGCDSPNYQGRCQVFSGEERNLRNIGWTDRISSLRRVRGGGGGGGGNRPPIGRVGIVLYEDPFFRGRSITLNQPTGNLRFQSFHDRAESIRVLSGRWEICSEPNFRRCQVVDRDVTNLSALGMNKKLSSLRPVGYGSGGGGYRPPYPGSGRLVFFERAGYRGPSVTIESASGDLEGFGGRARSVQVVGGSWLVCDRPRFSGRCREISASVPDLDQWGPGGRVMSARPVNGY